MKAKLVLLAWAACGLSACCHGGLEARTTERFGALSSIPGATHDPDWSAPGVPESRWAESLRRWGEAAQGLAVDARAEGASVLGGYARWLQENVPSLDTALRRRLQRAALCRNYVLAAEAAQALGWLDADFPTGVDGATPLCLPAP